MGKFTRTTGKYHGIETKDTGIRTQDDMRFYGLSSALTTPINNLNKDLIVQYTVKYDTKQECGGAYIKLLPNKDSSAFDADTFGGDTPYAIMFGPDVCGYNKRTHVILHSDVKDENILIEKDVPCETDSLSHMYRLHLKSDDTFEVSVDGKVVREGKLEEAFQLLEPKEIKDPEQSKPKDWVDEAEIDDPEDLKPEGYDDISPEIVDPASSKPEDWDDEEDGEWEAPMIPNPDYRGPWYPRRIPNPAYKGPWEHPMIPNPKYASSSTLHAVCGQKAGPCTHIGFELWSVKAGTMFDDIIITDDLAEATAFATETFFAKKEHEKLMQDEDERAQAEADAASAGDMDMEDFDMDAFGLGDEL